MRYTASKSQGKWCFTDDIKQYNADDFAMIIDCSADVLRMKAQGLHPNDFNEWIHTMMFKKKNKVPRTQKLFHGNDGSSCWVNCIQEAAPELTRNQIMGRLRKYESGEADVDFLFAPEHCLKRMGVATGGNLEWQQLGNKERNTYIPPFIENDVMCL